MAFVTAKDDNLIALEAVVRVDHDWPNHRVLLHLQGSDRPIAVEWSTWERASRSWLLSVIPAAPATYLISELEPESPQAAPEYWRETIVGWALNRSGEVFPVLVGEGAETDTSGSARIVQHPNGTVEETGQKLHASFDQFVAERAARAALAAGEE